MMRAMRKVIPLRKRPVDYVFILFLLVNLCFITYIVDIEQLTVANPANFEPPLWPPAPLVALVHWWGNTFDPVLMARPPWWRATIWIDVLFFGPYYAFALYAFIRGRDWIRVPSFLWAATMMTNVTIILFEEMIGPHATPRPGMVLFANAPWFLLPIGMIARMWLRPHPFTEAAPQEDGAKVIAA
jgi:hypothetical protein